MNYQLASAIYKGVWAIDPAYVRSQLPVLASFLNGETIVFGSPEAFQTRIVESDKGNVAVIPIKDVLMKNDSLSHTGTSTIGNTIQMAAKNPDIAGIVLDIDSPGGQIDGSQNLHDTIKNVTKPVVAFGNGLMASAAYWIGSAADQVIAGSETTIVGAVGTMMTLTDIRNAKQFKGVKFHEVYASKSTEKNKEFRELLDGDSKPMQKNILDPLNEVFLSAVKANRPLASENVFAGKTFIGKDAIKNGIVDSIGTLEEAINSVYEIQNTMKIFEKFPKLKALKGKNDLSKEEIAEVNKELAKEGLEGLQIKQIEKVDDNQGSDTAKTTTVTVETDKKEDPEEATLKSVADAVSALAEAVDAKFGEFEKELTNIKGNISSGGNPDDLKSNSMTVITDAKNIDGSPMRRRMKEINSKYQKTKTA